MARPRFTLIIPTRDRPAQLPYVLTSLCRQSFGDFEVILGDSDPGTQTGESYFSGMWPFLDARFRYVRNGLVGMSDNWDKCLAHATGQYVYVMQDKAILVPHALQRLDGAIRECEPDVLVFNQMGHTPFVPWNALERSGLPPLHFEDMAPPGPMREESAREVLKACAVGGWWQIFWLSPRSINSVCRLEVLQDIRARAGRAYGLPDPDITTAFLQLDAASRFFRLDEVLVSFGAHPEISSGLKFKTSIANGVAHINHLVGQERSLFEQMPLGFAPLFHNLLFADFKYAQQFAIGHLQGLRVRASDYWRLLEGDLEELRTTGIDCSGLERGVTRVRQAFDAEWI